MLATGETWRVIVDYPFDSQGYTRASDRARIEELQGSDSRTVFWLPLFLTDDMMGRVAQLAKINYLLGDLGTGDRLNTLAADWSVADRQQGKVYLQQRQQQVRASLLSALKQAYGAAKPEPADVEEDSIGVLHTLARGAAARRPARRHPADGVREPDRRAAGAGPTRASRTCPTTSGRSPGRAGQGAAVRAAGRRRRDPRHGGGHRRPQDHPAHLQPAAHRRAGRAPVRADHGHLLVEPALPAGGVEARLHRALPGAACCWSWWTRRSRTASTATSRTSSSRCSRWSSSLPGTSMARKVVVNSVQAVSDQLELRHPPMPSVESWRAAVERGRPLFGKPLPEWRSPATLGELAGTMREVARQYETYAAALVDGLAVHADVLGLTGGRGSARDRAASGGAAEVGSDGDRRRGAGRAGGAGRRR